MVQPLFLLLLFVFVAAAHAQQEKLQTEDVVVRTNAGGEFTFTTEMAMTPEQQSMGMMFRTEMGEFEGMLFVFPVTRRASFWMRNTLVPLDMIFVRPNGRIANIITAEPETDTSRRSKGRVKAVFEIPGGRAAELGIKAGDLLIHPAFGG
ncbi:MAG: DUF192 domain-containing protein [Kordiimonadaceae bacterium]|nr:DUF192 domain-containing protein [Kordiimonadaceae bacterium]MBO6570548.1 DUF192 domain-containing protein [Kordiimonadaceae bacterium]MBO6966333.1 DUF192 domain-containing protein [Kordiimonadaceae bacterium]